MTPRPRTILREPLPDSSQVATRAPSAEVASWGWLACPSVGIRRRGEKRSPSVETAWNSALTGAGPDDANNETNGMNPFHGDCGEITTRPEAVTIRELEACGSGRRAQSSGFRVLVLGSGSRSGFAGLAPGSRSKLHVPGSRFRVRGFRGDMSRGGACHRDAGSKLRDL